MIKLPIFLIITTMLIAYNARGEVLTTMDDLVMDPECMYSVYGCNNRNKELNWDMDKIGGGGSAIFYKDPTKPHAMEVSIR